MDRNHNAYKVRNDHIMYYDQKTQIQILTHELVCSLNKIKTHPSVQIMMHNETQISKNNVVFIIEKLCRKHMQPISCLDLSMPCSIHIQLPRVNCKESVSIAFVNHQFYSFQWNCPYQIWCHMVTWKEVTDFKTSIWLPQSKTSLTGIILAWDIMVKENVTATIGSYLKSHIWICEEDF